MNWNRMKAIFRRHVYVVRRSPHRWFDVAVWPLIDITIFGSIGVFAATQGDHDAAPRLLTGFVLFHVLWQSSIAMSTGFFEESWNRNVLNLMVTPITEAEYVGGIAMMALAKTALSLSITVTAALLLYSFNATDIGFGFAPLAFLLTVVGWAVGIAVIGLVLRYGQGAEIMAWGATGLMMSLSGVFFEVDALPAVVQPFAHALPTSHVFAAARSLVAGEGMPWNELWTAAAGTVVLTGLCLAYGIRMLAAFRQRGLVTRFS